MLVCTIGNRVDYDALLEAEAILESMSFLESSCHDLASSTSWDTTMKTALSLHCICSLRYETTSASCNEPINTSSRVWNRAQKQASKEPTLPITVGVSNLESKLKYLRLICRIVIQCLRWSGSWTNPSLYSLGMFNMNPSILHRSMQAGSLRNRMTVN